MYYDRSTRFGSSEYAVSAVKSDALTASDVCRGDGGELATLSSHEEDAHAKRLFIDASIE